MVMKEAKEWTQGFQKRCLWYSNYAEDHPDEFEAYLIIIKLLQANAKLKKSKKV